MNQEDLNNFLDAYITTMQLAGFDYHYEISSAVKTDVYYIKDKSNMDKSIMEFFYHKREYEGFIYVLKFWTDDLNVAVRTKEWFTKYGKGKDNEMESYYGHKARFGAGRVDEFIDFFNVCIFNRKEGKWYESI